MNNLLLELFAVGVPVLILVLTHFIKDGLKFAVARFLLSLSYYNVILKVAYYVKDQNVQALTNCMIVGAMIIPCWIVLEALKKLFSRGI